MPRTADSRKSATSSPAPSGKADALQEQITGLESMLSGQSEMPKPDAQTSADQLRRMLTVEMQSAQREASQANAEVQRLTIRENGARQRGLGRTGALVRSQSAARRSRTIAPSREVRIRQ